MALNVVGTNEGLRTRGRDQSARVQPSTDLINDGAKPRTIKALRIRASELSGAHRKFIKQSTSKSMAPELMRLTKQIGLTKQDRADLRGAMQEILADKEKPSKTAVLNAALQALHTKFGPEKVAEMNETAERVVLSNEDKFPGLHEAVSAMSKAEQAPQTIKFAPEARKKGELPAASKAA